MVRQQCQLLSLQQRGAVKSFGDGFSRVCLKARTSNSPKPGTLNCRSPKPKVFIGTDPLISSHLLELGNPQQPEEPQQPECAQVASRTYWAP